MTRIVIIGGVAAGTSAASQAKRRDPRAEVILLERGPEVSYGACGIPYNIEDEGRDINDLIAVSAEEFRTKRHVDVRTEHEVTAIDVEQRSVQVRNLQTNELVPLEYDELIITTGARASSVDLPGHDLPGVFVLRELTDGAAIKDYLVAHRVQRAVLIGAGYIGLELAEALRGRGISVRILEKGKQVAGGFAAPIAKVVDEQLAKHAVQVHTGVEIRAIERTARGLQVQTSEQAYACEIVIVSVGVKPNVELAEQAGISLGESGAIAVDEGQRTSAAHVFAAGDCAEAIQRVTGKPTWVPLGTTANKQGKVAGANAAGGKERFAGIVGTAAFKVFDVEVARAGLGSKELEREGIEYAESHSEHTSRAGSFGGGTAVHTVLFIEKSCQRLLGAQMVGEDAGKRIDVFAAALQARMTVDDLSELDLAYAPPIAPVYDPILIAASVAKKDLQKGSRS